MRVLGGSAVNNPALGKLGAQGEGPRASGIVVKQKLHHEMLTASDAELRSQEPGHHVEIVRRVESFIERPALAELDRKVSDVFRRAVSAHGRELDWRATRAFHDVGGDGTACQRFREDEWKRLSVVVEVSRRQRFRRIVAVLRAVERQLTGREPGVRYPL